MQAPGPTQASIEAQAAQLARQAQALAQAQAAGQSDVRAQAQALRDQAQAFRDQAQQFRDNARNGVTVPPPDFGRGLASQKQKMEFMGFIVVVLAAAAILLPIARAFGRRMEGGQARGPKLEDGSREQLQRIEQSIDAMAIEIERISEGQRFTTKLLSGREETRIPVGLRGDDPRSRPS